MSGDSDLWGAIRAIQTDTAATRQDIGWIKDDLKELKEQNAKQDEKREKQDEKTDSRLSALEQDQSRKRGRDGILYGAIAALVAFLTSFFSGGGVH